MTHDRRGFVGSMLGMGALPFLPRTGASETLPEFPPPQQSGFDVSWTNRVTGKHKAVFDTPEISMGLGLVRSLIWVKDYGTVYGVQPAEMSPVVVLRHNAIWFIMNDEFWNHHKIGAYTKITDPATRSPIRRNPVLGANPFGLPPALADDSLRKAIAAGPVLACNLAFQLDVVEYLKTQEKMEEGPAREMALRHVVPGVLIQPSGIFSVLRASEAGCHYFLASEA